MAENSSPWSTHCGICSPSSSLSASNRAGLIPARQDRGRSQSTGPGRPIPARWLQSAPPIQGGIRIGSTGRTFRYRIASCKRTGTCRSLLAFHVLPLGGVDRSSSKSKIRQCLAVIRRQRIVVHRCLNSSWFATSRYVCTPKTTTSPPNLAVSRKNLWQQHPPLGIHL